MEEKEAVQTTEDAVSKVSSKEYHTIAKLQEFHRIINELAEDALSNNNPELAHKLFQLMRDISMLDGDIQGAPLDSRYWFDQGRVWMLEKLGHAKPKGIIY